MQMRKERKEFRRKETELLTPRIKGSGAQDQGSEQWSGADRSGGE